MANCSAGSLNIRNKFCGGLQKHALVLLILLQLSQNEQYERVISGFAQTFSMPGQIRVITVDRHKRRQADIVEAPARSNTLFIIDDAEGLLMLFQVVQEGLGRQRLFQIVLAPAFIDIVKIPGPAPRPRRDRKVALGLQKTRMLLPFSRASSRLAAARSLMVKRNLLAISLCRPSSPQRKMPSFS